MFLSEELKLLFIHIPHTGGVSFKASFSNYGVDDLFPYLKTADQKKYVSYRLVFPTHVSMREAETAYNIDVLKYKRLSIVRNPWTRYASLWLAVRRNNQHRLTKFANTNSFRRFIEKLAAGDLGFDMNNQLYFLIDSAATLNFDFIIRFENYDADLLRVAEYFDVEIDIQKAEGRRKNPEPTDYFSMYGSREKQIVASLCEHEIEIFKYTFGNG